MKNKILIVLIMLIITSGCSKTVDRKEILLEKYESAYSELLAKDDFLEGSEHYNIEVAVNKLEDQSYRVDVIIDEPNIAMYNIVAIMEINSTGVMQLDEVNASLGLVDDEKFNLIPNQSKTEAGFYSGLILSGISDKSSGDVIVMINFTNYSQTKSFNECIKLQYDVDKIAVEVEEDEVEDQDDE